MTVNVDVHEMDDLDKDILRLVEETMPKECKKFMRREGGKLRTETKRKARSEIHKKTGNYLKSLKATRSWKSANGYGAKVISDHKIAPHSHLLEYGHRIVTHSGRDTGKKAKDFHIQESALYIFDGRFYSDTLQFIGDMVEKGLDG